VTGVQTCALPISVNQLVHAISPGRATFAVNNADDVTDDRPVGDLLQVLGDLLVELHRRDVVRRGAERPSLLGLALAQRAAFSNWTIPRVHLLRILCHADSFPVPWRAHAFAKTMVGYTLPDCRFRHYGGHCCFSERVARRDHRTRRHAGHLAADPFNSAAAFRPAGVGVCLVFHAGLRLARRARAQWLASSGVLDCNDFYCGHRRLWLRDGDGRTAIVQG